MKLSGGIILNTKDIILQTTSLDLLEGLNGGNVLETTSLGFLENIGGGNVLKITSDRITNFVDQKAEFWPKKVGDNLFIKA